MQCKKFIIKTFILANIVVPFSIISTDLTSKINKRMLEDTEEVLLEIEELIRGGVDINEPDSLGYAPLHLAIINQDIPLLKVLINNGANLDQVIGGANALHLHLSNVSQFKQNAPQRAKNLEIATLLIDEGIDINKENSWHETPLILAARKNLNNIVTLLLRRGAIPPSTPLWKLNPASKEYRVIKKIQRAWDTLEKKRPREIQKTEKLFRDKTGLPEDIIQMILRDTGA